MELNWLHRGIVEQWPLVVEGTEEQPSLPSTGMQFQIKYHRVTNHVAAFPNVLILIFYWIKYKTNFFHWCFSLP